MASALDPWGHLVSEVFADELAEGWDIRPTIAITKAQLNLPEIIEAMAAGRLKPDDDILSEYRRRERDQGRDRAGLVAARHRRALRRQGEPTCAARCSSRPAACIPSW